MEESCESKEDNDQKNMLYFIAEHPLGAQNLWIEAVKKCLPSTSRNGHPIRMYIHDSDKDWGGMKHDHTKFSMNLLSLEEHFDLFQVPSTYRLSVAVHSDVCADLQLLKNADEKILVPTIWENLYRTIRRDTDICWKIQSVVQNVIDSHPEDYTVFKNYQSYAESDDPKGYHPEQLNIRISVAAAIQDEDKLPEWLQIVLKHHYIDEEGDGDAVGLDGFVKMIQCKLQRNRRLFYENWDYRVAQEDDLKEPIPFFELKIYFNDVGYDLAIEVLKPTEIHDYCRDLILRHRCDYSAVLAYILDPQPDEIIMDFLENRTDVAAHVFKFKEEFWESHENIYYLKQRMSNITTSHGLIKKAAWSEVLQYPDRFKKVAKVLLDTKLVDEWWMKDKLKTFIHMGNIERLFEMLPSGAMVIIITREENEKMLTEFLKKSLKSAVEVCDKHLLYDEYEKRWKLVVKYKKLYTSFFQDPDTLTDFMKQVEDKARNFGDDFFNSSQQFDIERKEIFPKDPEDSLMEGGPSTSYDTADHPVPNNSTRSTCIELCEVKIELNGKYAAVARNGRPETPPRQPSPVPPDDWYVKNWNGEIPREWSPFSQATRGNEPTCDNGESWKKLKLDTRTASASGSYMHPTRPTACVKPIQKNTAQPAIVPLISPFVSEMPSTSAKPVIQPLVDPLAGRYEINSQKRPGEPLPPLNTESKARRWKPCRTAPPSLPNGFYDLVVNPEPKGYPPRIPRYKHSYYAGYFKTPFAPPSGPPPLSEPPGPLSFFNGI